MRRSIFVGIAAAAVLVMLAGCSSKRETQQDNTENKVELTDNIGTEDKTEDITTDDAEHTDEDTTAQPEGIVTGLKAYYPMTETPADSVLKDESGNGFDATVYGKLHTNYEAGALFFENRAYVELPAELFQGENTITVSLWLKNYSGAVNTSAFYIGTKENMPINYWLLNPANPNGRLKSVITDANDKGAPYNTEVGISPSLNYKGVLGPFTGMGWNHYATVITPSELIVYFNGEEAGRVPHKKTLSEFGEELAAYIGKSSYVADPTFTGFVKEVKICNTEVTQEEIMAEYMAGKPEEAKNNAVETEIFIAQRADPYITKGSDGYYYFTASYPMMGGRDTEGYDRVILRRATTIEGLKAAEEKVIWDEKESDTAFRFIWAPEIHEIDGKWYVYFAASGQSNNVWDINCHVIACEGGDPYNDSWTEKGKFQSNGTDPFPFTGFSLDMTYFECNGRHYVSWAQNGGNSNVYLGEIDPKEPWKLISNSMLLTKPEYYWEKVSIPVNEGPAAMIHDGKIFLAFSASATGPEYCLGLMYADVTADLLDKASWTKVETPLLTSEDLIGEYGPGHNSFVQDENGDWIFVYHSRDEVCYNKKCGYGKEDPLYDPCRSARIRRVKWSEDGMPVLNQ